MYRLCVNIQWYFQLNTCNPLNMSACAMFATARLAHRNWKHIWWTYLWNSFVLIHSMLKVGETDDKQHSNWLTDQEQIAVLSSNCQEGFITCWQLWLISSCFMLMKFNHWKVCFFCFPVHCTTATKQKLKCRWRVVSFVIKCNGVKCFCATYTCSVNLIVHLVVDSDGHKLLQK